MVIEKIQGMKSALEPEMPNQFECWSGYDSHVDAYLSMDDWNINVHVLNDFADNRPAHMTDHILQKFNLSGTADITIASSGPGGKVKLNSLVLDNFPWNGTYFTGVPVEVTALPEMGYRFSGWSGAASGTEPTVTLDPVDGMEVTAIFEKAADDVVLTKTGSPHTFLVSQSVGAGHSLTIEAGAEVIMAPGIALHVLGELHVNGTAEEPVVIRGADTTNRWDRIFIENPTGPCTISHATISGAKAGGDASNLAGALTTRNADISVENCTFDSNVQCLVGDGGTVAVRSCTFTAGNRNEHLHILRATALVENCTFRGVIEEDAIDFDYITDGVIRNCSILSTKNPDRNHRPCDLPQKRYRCGGLPEGLAHLRRGHRGGAQFHTRGFDGSRTVHRRAFLNRSDILSRRHGRSHRYGHSACRSALCGPGCPLLRAQFGFARP